MEAHAGGSQGIAARKPGYRGADDERRDHLARRVLPLAGLSDGSQIPR